MKSAALGFCLSILTFLDFGAAPAWAQLAPLNPEGVTLAHVHLAVKDVAAQKAFWIDIMGGKPVKNGPVELIEFPGVYIMLRQSNDAAPPAGAILDHFGFVVKDMPAMVAKWKAHNLETQPTENPNEIYVVAPDGIRVEVYGIPSLPTPIQMNHLHYLAFDVPGMQAWYNRNLGAVISKRACIGCVSKPSLIETVNMPGNVNFSFSVAKDRRAPTKGRSIDHIGFEVKNLEAYVKDLEANGIKMDEQVRQISNTKIKIAFLTDPWGTRIELTENLAP